MRYIGISNIVFEYENNRFVEIKDIYDIPEYEISVDTAITKNSMLDEIASRDNVYGEEAEYLSYKLFEANIVQIVDYNFTLDGLSRLKIPT